MNKPLLLLLILFLSACENNQQKMTENIFEVNTPNLLSDVSHELMLSELADSVWYIPLETADNVLLGDLAEVSCKYTEDTFYIYDTQQGSIYVFSANGKFRNKIGKIGQGADEIGYFLDYTTDGKLVYVADFGKKLHRFKKDGSYLGYVHLPKQAYKLMSIGKNEIACYITDEQFGNSDNAYSWLIINSEGDSVSCRKTFEMREPDKGKLTNHHVVHDLSTEHPFAYKEAYNDSLYHFDKEGNISAYGYIDLGIHKLDPLLSLDEIITQEHAMRLSRIYDIPHYLIAKGRCLCIKDKVTWFVYNKDTDDFFLLQDSNITNDSGGPDFQPFCCVYPGLLIGIAEPTDCPDEFAKQYGIKPDDNPILVMVKCK